MSGDAVTPNAGPGLLLNCLVKETVTKLIDTLTQKDLYGAFQKVLERYNKCIAAGGDNFHGDYSFMCVLSIKVPIRNKVWKLI